MPYYLVMASLFIGPLEEDACQQAAKYIPPAMCRKSDYMYACDVNNIPGVYKLCPHFTYPQVIIK